VIWALSLNRRYSPVLWVFLYQETAPSGWNRGSATRRRGRRSAQFWRSRCRRPAVGSGHPFAHVRGHDVAHPHRPEAWHEVLVQQVGVPRASGGPHLVVGQQGLLEYCRKVCRDLAGSPTRPSSSRTSAPCQAPGRPGAFTPQKTQPCVPAWQWPPVAKTVTGLHITTTRFA
jgi:hypothetical protein